jgi:RimJ/RimL family protein N-acetyltransferase
MLLTDGVISLSAPRDEDAPAVAAVVQASLATLEVWMPWATSEYSADSARVWMAESRRLGVHSFLVRDPDGTVIGSLGLQRADALNRCIELGYWIGQAHTGRGYATRAARLAIGFAVGELGIHRVGIKIAVANTQSQRVAERLGARLEGRLTDRLLVRGEWHDAYLYAVIA